MNTLDLLIIAIVIGLAMLGYAQGFIIGFASLFGLALGGVVGTRVTHVVLDRSADSASASAWAPIIGLAIGLLITVIGAMAMQDLGAELRGRVEVGDHEIVDRILGGVLLASVGLVLVWFAAASAIGVPQLRELRPQLVESSIITRLNSVLPPAGPILGAISSYDPFPEFDGGRITAAAPDRQLPSDPEVAAAARSVVRVVGTACGYQVTGSGWPLTSTYIVTNAHVVAGQRDTAIEVRDRDEPVDANVVHFDEINDLAILRVADVGLRPLKMVRQPERGTAAVVIGFPENQGLTTTPARFSDERTVRADDIHGQGEHERRIIGFRGTVRHGNSGGPLVDGDGRVLGTVFAATVGERIAGGYGVPNAITADAMTQAAKVPRGFGASTGRCIA